MIPLWQPSEQFQQNSNLKSYIDWLIINKGLEFGEDYHQLWQWSIDQLAVFWETIWEYYEIKSYSPYHQVLSIPETDTMIGTKWFEGATLNYAEHVFRNQTDAYPAIVFQSETQVLTHITWQDLEHQVATMATYLRSIGVEKGDRVVNFMPNIPQTVIAFLAANSIGAIWSSCSPDFGTKSVVDRFQQIEPKVLFTADAYSYNGKIYDKTEAIQSLIADLPTLEQVVYLPYIHSDRKGDNIPKSVLWQEAMNTPTQHLVFESVPFEHPIWIVYSSGTTGKPKAITHSVGGSLVEHYKALGLHQNCQIGDRFFWYSTTGWMMWNYALASLLLDATLVIYDGSAGYPNIEQLWNFAEQAHITHFGGGASYYIACMKDGLNFVNSNKLAKLQSIGSTGSPLPPEAFEWIYNFVKKDVWLISLSGGTDICSGFVGGSPFLPVYKGEIQCRMLGVDLQAYNEEGISVIEELGEMIIAQPMPSMPIYFWNDAGNQRYHSSYFETYPNVWRHGDWIKITDRDTSIIYGRSDATLNRGGVRIGTSEVYSGVEQLEAVKDSIVICLDKEGGQHYMPLFVVLQDGLKLTPDLKQKIKNNLRSLFSPRHVPDAIFQIEEVPYTISGKKMETPIKKILMGVPLEKAISKGAMKNTHSLHYFINFANENKI